MVTYLDLENILFKIKKWRANSIGNPYNLNCDFSFDVCENCDIVLEANNLVDVGIRFRLGTKLEPSTLKAIENFPNIKKYRGEISKKAFSEISITGVCSSVSRLSRNPSWINPPETVEGLETYICSKLQPAVVCRTIFDYLSGSNIISLNFHSHTYKYQLYPKYCSEIKENRYIQDISILEKEQPDDWIKLILDEIPIGKLLLGILEITPDSINFKGYRVIKLLGKDTITSSSPASVSIPNCEIKGVGDLKLKRSHLANALTKLIL